MKTSGGILLYRRTVAGPEVFLVHPGGPFFTKKDKGWWTIPKGLPNENESLEEAARREFTEETGIPILESALIELGSVKQKGGKTVHAWAVEGDLPESWQLQCNTFKVEWPPRSGKYQSFPEVDQGRFFPLEEAYEYINEAQREFLRKIEIFSGNN